MISDSLSFSYVSNAFIIMRQINIMNPSEFSKVLSPPSFRIESAMLSSEQLLELVRAPGAPEHLLEHVFVMIASCEQNIFNL